MTHWSARRHVSAVLLLAMACLSLTLGGCAMVKVKSLGAEDYIAAKRGDVLSSGELSAASLEALQVLGIEAKTCTADVPACAKTLSTSEGLDEERKLSTSAELWTQAAIRLTPKGEAAQSDATVGAWLEAARYAYAYLFFSPRVPGERAFEDRQTQVRDYYNYAVQQVVGSLFARWRAQIASDGGVRRDTEMDVAGWRVNAEATELRMPGGVPYPDAIAPASSLRFEGVRSVYRRDGFGAELVAEVSPAAVGDPAAYPGALPGTPLAGESRDDKAPAFSEMPFMPVTLLLRFDGQTLAQVLTTRRVLISPYDPYRQADVIVQGQRLPLAANFTAGYGLWLARSGFAKQSLRSMLGRERGIVRPHLYLMQPYDPERRIVLMLHGLASSPEAWVNVANEIMGDEQLRRHYQIWQVYYPTNMPIAWNRAEIAKLVEQALKHFDPTGQAPASQHMVLIGHSMGGVLARLLVSSSGDQLWSAVTAGRDLSGDRGERIRRRLQPLLNFQPLPQVDRAVFIAAPHRGTAMADGGLGRFVGKLIRLPATLLTRFADVLSDLAGNEKGEGRKHKRAMPNSIDNLRDTDPFVHAAADLPISPRVRYNSIIAQRDPKLPLVDSDDGLVPYRSAHLAGAESELVITSWHSVQETPQAILEIRRILHKQIGTE